MTVATPFREPVTSLQGSAALGAREGPALSVIVLTKNEAANLEDAVRSLLEQDVPLEVLIVDGGSTDGTVAIARGLEDEQPWRVTLVASRNLPIGPARNVGLAAARAPYVAFMSADATAAPGWARAMVEELDDADIVYGRQEHTPLRWCVATVVRGLRYHHFASDRRRAPETYASNVNAAIRRDVFTRLRYVDEGAASALDDILFTHEAQELGLRVAYTRNAIVNHRDAATLKAELAKNQREGFGWGLLAPRLGWNLPVLAWGGAIIVALALFAFLPFFLALGLLFLILYAPALRRALRAAPRYLKRAPDLLGALALSPAFDLVFLLHYIRGAAVRRSDLTGRLETQGTRSP